MMATESRTPRNDADPAARDSGTPIPPIVLTAQSLLESRADLAQALRDAGMELRGMVDWEQLPEAAERIPAAALLVDMDAVDDAHGGTQTLSGYRLVTLLARHLAGRPTALLVMTRLDFAEIEELVRGIHALVPPSASSKELVAHIAAARRRVALGTGTALQASAVHPGVPHGGAQ
jgi:hypothetical protein